MPKPRSACGEKHRPGRVLISPLPDLEVLVCIRRAQGRLIRQCCSASMLADHLSRALPDVRVDGLLDLVSCLFSMLEAGLHPRRCALFSLLPPVQLAAEMDWVAVWPLQFSFSVLLLTMKRGHRARATALLCCFDTTSTALQVEGGALQVRR